MDKKLLNRLFIIAWALLSLAGIGFLCISLFSDDKTTTPLALGLGSIGLANILNVIRLMVMKEK